MQKHQVRGIAALIAASGFAVGNAAAEPTVVDWLLPQTGLWSDGANWAGGDVPDTLDEIARISPDPGEGLETFAALVDQSFIVEALEGSGVLDVVIQQGASLAVGSLIEGTGAEPLNIFVGDDSLVAGGSVLELIGTGAPREGRANLNNVRIQLTGPDTELIAIEETRIGSDSVIAGSGRIGGSFVNSGRIVAESNFDGEVITIDGAEIRGSGVLAAEPAAELRINRSAIIAGVMEGLGGSI
ncbi:MAG: hypothetical protein AAFY46_17240, partial [Planctomycetota bacterium]